MLLVEDEAISRARRPDSGKILATSRYLWSRRIGRALVVVELKPHLGLLPFQFFVDIFFFDCDCEKTKTHYFPLCYVSRRRDSVSNISSVQIWKTSVGCLPMAAIASLISVSFGPLLVGWLVLVWRSLLGLALVWSLHYCWGL